MNRTLPSAKTWFAPPVWKAYVSLSLWQLMTELPGLAGLVFEKGAVRAGGVGEGERGEEFVGAGRPPVDPAWGGRADKRLDRGLEYPLIIGRAGHNGGRGEPRELHVVLLGHVILFDVRQEVHTPRVGNP